MLITILGPVSGAHFNPAVSLAMTGLKQMPARETLPYCLAQIGGGLIGTVIAHLMFSVVPVTVGLKLRSGPEQWFAEGVATAGLLLVILGGIRHRADAVAWLVGLYITAAYWFTASTSFANPAVTIARAFTPTFSGIRPLDAPAFILAQLAGAAVGIALARLVFGPFVRDRS